MLHDLPAMYHQVPEDLKRLGAQGDLGIMAPQWPLRPC